MNNGKICVSVFADTARELIEQLRRAEEAGDVVELRLDGLDRENLWAAIDRISSRKPLLLTMRPKEQGGRSSMNITERIEFWKELAPRISADRETVWVDHEYDLMPHNDLNPENSRLVVRSRHYFDGPGTDLDETYETIVSDKEVAKIAVSAPDAVDAIHVWKLLERANEEGKRLIVIAMGEAGKWTRILGPACGSYMTYAALEFGGETAAGQVTARELNDVFRARELDRDTKIYGIVAGNTGYSISPWMHNAGFRAAGLNSVFVPLQTADVAAFLKRMVRPGSREVELNFGGFSVTNPHKEAIMPLLDEFDESAERIGAVNTVKIEGDRLTGFNTDAFGFISTLKKEFGDLKSVRVAVFGCGGAARACLYTLAAAGAAVTVFARNVEKGSALAEEFGAPFERSAEGHEIGQEFDVAVNTTPLGTAGANADHAVLTASQIDGLKLVYDLVYNPAETKLMMEARKANVPAVNGMDMLIAQGAKQFEIWTGMEPPVGEMRAAVEKRLGA